MKDTEQKIEGLPELPEGYFFRVRIVNNMFAGALVRTEIRKRWWKFSTLKHRGHAYPWTYGTTEETIRREARALLRELERDNKVPSLYRYEGDYEGGH